MNKNYLFVILVVLLLIMGCEKKDTGPSKTDTFIGGTDSIEIAFMEGSPPLEVYDGGGFPFDVVLKLENKGEYDVKKENIKIRLSGIDPSQFNNPAMEKNPDEDLDGAYIDPDGNKIEGAQTYVNFQGFNYLESLVGNTQFTLRADVCYLYGTKAQTMLCVLEDLTSKKDKVCNPSEVKSIEVSSAPVQIANFKEEVSGTDKVTFSFEITHKGTGAIARHNSGCSDSLADKDKVYVKVDTGLNGLACSGLEGSSGTEGFVTLYGGNRIVRCTQDVASATGDFEKPVSIGLEYDYKEHVDTPLLVKHSTG